MDVARLTTATAIGNMDVPRDRVSDAGNPPTEQAKVAPHPEPDKTHVKAVLDKIIRNTRFQYDIKDELGYFVVRIIDQDTDKIIREIPSRELQKVHEGIEQALGLLFDEFI